MYRVNFIKRFVLLILLLVVSINLSCVSIQVQRDMEYKLLKKHYKYMNKEAYKFIKWWSNDRKIDIILTCSLIDYESGDCRKTKFNWEKMKRVHSRSNAIGVMQLLRKYHGGKNWRDLYDPNINIKRGTMYLKLCIMKSRRQGFKNVYAEALRMYNSGMGADRDDYPDYLWNNYVYRIMVKYEKVKNDMWNA